MSKNFSEMLEELGLSRIESSLPELCSYAAKMADAAGRDDDRPAFEAFPSYIPPVAPEVNFECVLIIDIGGTSTKTAIRRKTGNEFTWTMLFEAKNLETMPGTGSGNSFIKFSEIISEQIISTLDALKIAPSAIEAMAVVWSNAIENRIDDKYNVTGVIADRLHYNKGEWFIGDLEDGDDIGQMLFGALSQRGLSVDTFLIANDTPFTMKANPVAHAGMVASTGLNGTLVKNLQELDPSAPSRRVICNAEMGGRMVIDSAFRTRADFIDDDEEAEYLEFLTAGRFLPQLFVSYIIALEQQGVSAFTPLADYLKSLGPARWNEFRSKDMNLLTLDKEDFVSRRESADLYTAEVLGLLEELALALFRRSAVLCALVAYATVSNQLQENSRRIVSVDSRLGREIPSFMGIFKEALASITPPSTTIELSLMSPIDLGKYEKISVPMQGAAYSLDSLLTFRRSEQ